MIWSRVMLPSLVLKFSLHKLITKYSFFSNVIKHVRFSSGLTPFLNFNRKMLSNIAAAISNQAAIASEVTDLDAYSQRSEDSDFDEYEECDCVAHGAKPAIIPYTTVFEATAAEEDVQFYFVPAKPVEARIINMQVSDEPHLLNPFLYTIELRHNNYTWRVHRHYRDFSHLHHSLQRHRIAERIRHPVRQLKEEVEEIFDEDDEGSQQGDEKEGPALHRLDGAGGDNNGTAAAAAAAGPARIHRCSKHSRTSRATRSTMDSGRDEIDAGDKLTPRSADTTKPSARSETKRAVHSHSHCRLPHFPITPERMLMGNQGSLEQRKAELEQYLQTVLHISFYRNHKSTAEFLEVSRLSFVHNIGAKSKEGLLRKRPGGRRTYHGCRRFCIAHCAPWGERWLLLKDSFVAYLHPRHEDLHAVLLFDRDFNVKAGAAETEGIKHGILIQNLERFLLLKCESSDHAKLWSESIHNFVQDRGNLWVQPKRFESFAPVREKSYAEWFVDGKTYMAQVANMLELAKEEIFITDWWLSPEIYLKRPINMEDHGWRLDQVLRRKAEQGVRVFVLLYKEVEMALGLNSVYSKRVLQSAHQNIKVIRHPDHLPGGTFLWAHHEKLVCIDQNIAFVGGIDLCYGRWDDYAHRLSDLGALVEPDASPPTQPSTMPSQTPAGSQPQQSALNSGAMRSLAQSGIVPLASSEDSTPRASRAPTFISPDSSAISPVVEEDVEAVAPKPQAPQSSKWKAMAAMANRSRSVAHPKTTTTTGTASTAHPALSRAFSAEAGPARVAKLAQLVADYKKFVDSGGALEAKKRAETPPMERKRNKLRQGLTLGAAKWKRAVQRRQTEIDEGKAYEEAWMRLQANEEDATDGSAPSKIWLGKDYVNFIFKDFTDLDLPFHDFIDRASTPRMPWHDIASVVYGAAARDVARHFIQRWNAAKQEKLKQDDEYPYLVPKSYERVGVPHVFRGIAQRATVQVVRSSSSWSAGMNFTEDSIMRAYVDMISKAEHYIYIENQFFVSQLESQDVTNQICQALYDRIIRAHRDNEKFRVYVLLPLLPAFEGQIGTDQGSALQVVLHWAFVSISKGKHALLPRLAETIDDPRKYISFCSLRTFDSLSGRLVTEEVYIHSKLMIVDDKRAIIGSANINDRSQLGKRDSEVCVVVEDEEFVDSTLGGQPYRSGKFCGSLRTQLFKEHMGLLTAGADDAPKFDVEDILSDDFYFHTYLRVASKNTDIFERVFRCIPTDEVSSVEEMQRYQEQIPLAELHPDRAQNLLKEVQGYLVLFPSRFLFQSNLAPAVMTKEGLAPVALFV